MPASVGAKCPWIVQLPPAARLAPQLFANTNEEAPVPPSAMLVMDRVSSPVFVTITDFEELVESTFTVPYDRLVADSFTAGAATPVPLSAMLWGDPVASSVIVTVAVSMPASVGAKCPWIVQLPPAARLAPQLFANTNEEAFVPVTAMLAIDNAAALVLVRVTGCDALSVPTACGPYEMLLAERDTVNPAMVALPVAMPPEATPKALTGHTWK